MSVSKIPESRFPETRIFNRFHLRHGEISVDLDLDVNLIMVCNCRDFYKDYLLRMMGTDTRYADINRVAWAILNL